MGIGETIGKLSDRVDILGVMVSATNLDMVTSTIQGWIEKGERHYICVASVHGIMECHRDEALRRIHNSSGLTVPDGMPLVWAGHLFGFSQMGRVYGPALMTEVCRMSVREGYTHFLYGGNLGVAGELRRRLSEKFPGIEIVGTYTPPFRPLNPSEEVGLIEVVARLKPDIFWVGLSTPKQERFMAAYLPKLDTKIMLGVGAAFDFHTGRIRDAPGWTKKAGLQWLHRLFQEPGRLWKRYLVNNSLFILYFIQQLISREKLTSGRSTKACR